MNDAVAAVLAGAAEVSGWQEDLYRDLHSHPELSHQEHRTAGKAADRLTTAPLFLRPGLRAKNLMPPAALQLPPRICIQGIRIGLRVRPTVLRRVRKDCREPHTASGKYPRYSRQ